MFSSVNSGNNRRSFTTFAYFIAFIGLGLTGAVLGPTLPALSDLTRTTLSQISILFAARSLGYLVSSILSGHLYDRISGHILMGVSLVGMCVSLIITPYVSLLWVLTGVLFFTGFSQAVVDVGGNTLIVWLHGRRVGPYMNALHMFYGIGTFIAPIVIAQSIIRSGSVTPGYWVIAAFILLSALQIFVIPSQKIPASASGKDTNQSGQLLVLLAAGLIFCYSSFANIFGGWIFTYVTQLSLTTEANAAYLTSIFWGAFTIGRLFSIPIAARFNPGRILLGDLLGCLISIGIILIFPTSIAAIWIGAAGLGISAASLFPTTVSLVERRIEITGKITSWFVVGSALGAMIPPWIVGQLIETTYSLVIMISVLVMIVFGLIVYFFMMRESTSIQVTNNIN